MIMVLLSTSFCDLGFMGSQVTLSADFYNSLSSPPQAFHSLPTTLRWDFLHSYSYRLFFSPEHSILFPLGRGSVCLESPLWLLMPPKKEWKTLPKSICLQCASIAKPSLGCTHTRAGSPQMAIFPRPRQSDDLDTFLLRRMVRFCRIQHVR